MLNSNVGFKCWIQMLDLNIKCWIQMFISNVGFKCTIQILKSVLIASIDHFDLVCFSMSDYHGLIKQESNKCRSCSSSKCQRYPIQ